MNAFNFLPHRGIQAHDPFFTIWEVDSNLALIFIITAILASSCYFVFLCYHVYLVMRTISSKQTSLPSMSSTRRLIYQGIIYRFKFLLIATLVCAASTMTAYIFGQVKEDMAGWEDELLNESYHIEWTSAMFTTVYAMWNCYIITLLILYAPSHKGVSHISLASSARNWLFIGSRLSLMCFRWVRTCRTTRCRTKLNSID